MVALSGDPDAPFTVGRWGHCISITRGGKLVGGVVYDNWWQVSIGMHICGLEENFITRDFLWAIYHYPFEQLKVDKVFGLVASTNPKAMNIAEHMGFTPEGKMVGAIKGGDLVIYAMYRADCRWLRIVPKNLKAGAGRTTS